MSRWVAFRMAYEAAVDVFFMMYKGVRAVESTEQFDSMTATVTVFADPK